MLPALAVAEGLVAARPRPGEIHYVGAERGIETRLLPATPFPHTFFDVVGFQRAPAPAATSRFLPKLWRARRRAIAAFRTLRPRVVVTVGGYASLPAVLAARATAGAGRRGQLRPVPGPGQRAVGAARCRVRRRLPRLDRCPGPTLTGAPIRQAILDVDRRRDRAAARDALGLPHDRFVVAVIGGSQGSGVLNDAVGRLLDRWAGDTGAAVRHVVGERFLDAARPPLDGSTGVLYQAVGYEPRMPLVYAAADLLVGRGGASTVAEVAVTGIPAILVPWAASAEDHQTANVAWLADDGAAVLLRRGCARRVRRGGRRLRGDAAERSALSAAASTRRGGPPRRRVGPARGVGGSSLSAP